MSLSHQLLSLILENTSEERVVTQVFLIFEGVSQNPKTMVVYQLEETVFDLISGFILKRSHFANWEYPREP